MQILVTGAGGFLGFGIAAALVQSGHAVRTLQRGRYPQLEALGCEAIQGDLADPSTVTRAAEGCQAVFHVAAKAGVWGPRSDYERPNLTGTANILTACRTAGTEYLIYTSSPSVVYDGGDQSGVDESVPYPTKFATHYQATKAAAEKLVLEAHSPTLSTIALRPHLIWGPGDPHLIPRLVERARRGRVRQVGPGKNLVDAVFIDNAVDAHLAAFRTLGSADGESAGGKPYFITNGEPVPLWPFLNEILSVFGVPPVKKRVSLAFAQTVGGMLEGVYGMLGITREPPMTRFVASQLGTAHWFRIDAARTRLGYEPVITMAEGMNRLRAAVRSGEYVV